MVVVDYVTKWVEAIPTSSADHNTSIKMLKEVERTCGAPMFGFGN